MVRQHIGDDGRRLAGTHMRQLVFLEVSVNPQAVRGYQGEAAAYRC